ncbi:LOW QUALITY PROTEIN: hypothetical protein Cgig2_020761 [Carnegiea gigantea]|uniref:Uncharacterized protein n=1 Tax=Carnegiea gigantea TaxID=171969 RepID=A0A9Q1QAK0_9CARY|nr:LOW QUALITY PROTEIN: hypothetical protein Cgig2_020761 [Carnegiea gigantea]
MSPPVALMLGLSRFLSPHRGLGLCPRTGLLQLVLQRHLYLAAESSDLWHSAWRSRIRPFRTKIDECSSKCLAKHSIWSAKERTSNKVEGSRGRLVLTLGMAGRSLDRRYADGPSIPLSLEGGGSSFREGQKPRPWLGPPLCAGTCAYPPEGGSPIPREASDSAVPTLAPIKWNKKVS